MLVVEVTFFISESDMKHKTKVYEILSVWCSSLRFEPSANCLPPKVKGFKLMNDETIADKKLKWDN